MSATVVEYDRAAAERRAERIQLRLDTIADNYAAVMPMIRDSIEKRDDIALGYNGVSAYISDRFGHSLQRLGITVRREVHRELEAAGMSVRSIAKVTGVSKSTVADDISGVQNRTPEPPADDVIDAEIEGDPEDYWTDQADLDATTSAADPEGSDRSAEDTDEHLQDGSRSVSSGPPAPEPPKVAAPGAVPTKVTGLDGKTYTKRKPVKPKRRPITDDARDAGQELRKAIERLQRIAGDERLSRNASEVAAHLRHHLTNAIEVCQDLNNKIN